MRPSIRVPLLLSGLVLYICAFAPAGMTPVEYEQDLVVRFQRVFAPEDLPPGVRTPGARPSKCATSLLQEFDERRDDLPASVVSLLDGYLTPTRTAAFVHETEHFQLAYDTFGPDAVPAIDVDPANGVPDFVEAVGGWAEVSWAHHVDAMGFARPVPAGARIAVAFREMAAYGYTERVDGTPRLVLHRSFEGFPANHDPEGSSRGAAKVTIAHELRHACQLATSGWTEGAWLEADATFAEDRVFDVVNDYIHYLQSASPISDPVEWAWNGPGYEDCLWQHLLAEIHGEAIATDFFRHRASHSGAPVISCFDEILRARGSSLASMAARLGVWSHFCGANAIGRPEGFEEAHLYPTPVVNAHVSGIPAIDQGQILGLGTRAILATAPGVVGRPQLFVAGDASRSFAVHAIALETNGARRVFPVAITAGRSEIAELPILWSELVFLAIRITVVDGNALPAHATLSLDDDLAVGVNDAGNAARLELLPNRPNPFAGVTTIAFSLPQPASARLLVFDATGRLVRTLLDRGTLPAGRHESTWEGNDDRGVRVAPGVYAVSLESAQGRVSQKVHLLR